MEKLQQMCCRLSRDAWIVHTTSTKGQFKVIDLLVMLMSFNYNLYIPGNSKQKWENMLMEITKMEYMVVKCYSVIRKLYPNVENLESNVSVSVIVW